MKKTHLILVILLLWISVKAQPTHVPEDNANIHAGAYSYHFLDAFSYQVNPACLGKISGFSAGLLTERKWMMNELGNHQLSVVCDVGKAGLGIAIKHSGDKDYREQGLEIAMGKNLGRLDLGIGFSYLMSQAAGYRQVGFGASEIGIRYPISEKLIAGFDIGLELFGSTGKSNIEKGPRFFRMGFGYEWSEYIFIAVQIEKSSGLPSNVISSIDYRYAEQFFFSFGMNTMAGTPFFKAGWKKNRVSIQIYTTYEPVLGFSPGLIFLWENKNKAG